MWGCVVLVCFFLLNNASALWEAHARCPIICTCRLEHLTETPIHRFMQNNKNRPIHGEIQSIELNDVIPDESLETEIFHDKPIVRSATCILQTETVPTTLIQSLPMDIEMLTLIQGYKSGNKTIKLSDMLQFKQLLSVELLGPQLFNNETSSHLFCEIDKPLTDLKYLSLERILIKNSKNQIQNFVKEVSEEEMTFEYTQKFDSNSPLLTIVQQGTNEEVLPYTKYKKNEEYARVPLFFGFKNLNLLRITSCELNVVHWEMFDGLLNLEYLILENNNLHFIPPFAFYGTANLKTLSLSHNNLLDIQITDLAGLLELAYLDLSFNNFSQLSELSLPPFPKLKLANFANNPITVVFPNTFEVMNTTDSLIIGSDDMELRLIKNSFLGLDSLKILTLKNLHIKSFKKELLSGMPDMQELIVTGNITELEFDAFTEVFKLVKLILSNCKIQNISMDSFVGLRQLEYLDLSKNDLEYLPPNVFDDLTSIKELYLNDNKFIELPHYIFAKIHPKLLRLNKNPWHCSCKMSEWKPMIINKLKRKTIKQCDRSLDKGVNCNSENRVYFKYVYDNKIAPKCASPVQYENWSVFQVMRRLLKCRDYKPKLRKHYRNATRDNYHNISEETSSSIKTNLDNYESKRVNNLEGMNTTVHKPNISKIYHEENQISSSENNNIIPSIHSFEEADLSVLNPLDISYNQPNLKLSTITNKIPHIHKRRRIHRIRKHHYVSKRARVNKS
ncbi:hypothetical protein WA026_004775 [Henosepilachna vigintioctopunctata]|uniref:Uncharacterized protein n=1 Tax=Henosepilachna vigintioctopunctata TaxID=420089 RepID=A0AAW1V7V1_9CUCU